MQMGDGCIRQCGFFKIDGTIEKYQNFKRDILNQLTETKLRVEKKKIGSSYGTKDIYSITTKVHPIYKKLRLHTYKNDGKRQITNYSVSLLNELGILLWYLDDGCLDTCGGGIKFLFFTSAYSEPEQQLLMKVLNDKFRLRFSLRKQYKKQTGKTYYFLYLKAADGLVFWDKIIAPFVGRIPDEMKYKIPKREDIESKMLSDKHARFYKNIV